MGWNYQESLDAFRSLPPDKRIYTYIDFPSFRMMRSRVFYHREGYISRIISHCDRIAVGGVLPRLKDHSGMNDEDLQLMRQFYKKLLRNASKSSVKVGFAPEFAYQEYLLRTLPKEKSDALVGKELIVHEHLCDADRTVKYTLHGGGKLMSLVAFDDEKLKPETVDLRELVHDGVLEWTPEKRGNWRILEFVCVNTEKESSVDVLSYAASKEMLSIIWNLFGDILTPYAGSTLHAMEYHDISFDAPNRRSWSENFNEEFERLYGFDPAPYYPALFRNTGNENAHLRAMLFSCRAKMMQNGFLRAVADFAAEKGLILLGSMTEPKLTACPWITGDNLLNGMYAPGALLDKAYLYGTNSLKIAAAASYNFDRSRVTCELYRNYYRASKAIFYNDAMNALARGANRMMVHIPILEEQENKKMMRALIASHWESQFSKYIGRVQSLLAGGRHVSDIALLYPIYHLCGKTNFYTSSTSPKQFEYPNAPATADYMNVINSVSTYAGHDLTVLHPEVFHTRCRTDGGTLYLDNEENRESFRILILPAMEIISIENMRKIAEFYDGGGKVIATGALPSEAYEYLPEAHDKARKRGKLSENDQEVRRLVEHVFGKESFDPYVIRPFFYNENEGGGEAYFLPFTTTAADGTATTKSKLLSDAIHSFELPLDIYMPDMPRLECIGALNSVYPEFEALGLSKRIPGGGMLNHIHKKHGDCDVYYFSNTTNDPFDSYLLLRGRLHPEEWDPYTGETKPLPHTVVIYKNNEYTRIPVKLAPSTSILFVSDPSRAVLEEPTEKTSTLDSIEGLA